MTSVVMVSGSWPPQACGVGDYTEMLCRELERQAISVVRFVSGKLTRLWSLETIDRINRLECDLVHIQYPTAGYGRSITPSALARSIHNKPVLVTLHEYSVFRWYRRAWFSPFAQHCAARVFTTDAERELFQRRFPARRGMDLTIEIGSNIPASTDGARQPDRVCYFGLIAPNKGIEEFLDLCAIAAASASGLTFELIGAVPERHGRYADEIAKRALAYGVHMSFGLPDDAVAGRLARSTFAYLPFPDGATAKRGTLAAAIVNGAIVVTRHSDITPGWIRSITLDAKTPLDALGIIARLQNDGERLSSMAERNASAARRFRWDAIARRHAELYRQLLHPSIRRGPATRTEYVVPNERGVSRLAS